MAAFRDGGLRSVHPACQDPAGLLEQRPPRDAVRTPSSSNARHLAKPLWREWDERPDAGPPEPESLPTPAWCSIPGRQAEDTSMVCRIILGMIKFMIN